MRLRLRLPHQPSATVDLDSVKANFGDLLKEVTDLSGLEEKSFTLKSGFPPREILAASSTPLSEILSDHETVTVHCTSILPVTRVAGDTSFGEVGLSKPPTSSKSPKKKAQPSLSSASLFTGLPNVRSLHDTPRRSTPPSRAPASCEATTPKRRRTGGGLNLGSSEEDWSVNLVDIFSKSGADLSKAQRALRGAFRNAVQRREASTLAERRWTSASTDTATFEDLESHKFRVTFPVSARKNENETYIALPKPFLSVVLREVYSAGGESQINLRPHYMAEGQPLVFWNVVRHFGGTNFSTGLKELMPYVSDWSFYTEERERILSEKGAANIRQREETKSRRVERMKQRLVTLGEYSEGMKLQYDEEDYSDSLYSENSDAVNSGDSVDGEKESKEKL
eukprot:Lankesteria_metandrocarpae@DN5564_c0_g1_i1.p1